MLSLPLLISIGLVGLLVVVVATSIMFRRVVSTNEVHIVQSARKTQSYGKDTPNGNVYYEWPSWIPKFGISKIVLPVSVFDLDLAAYEAYDKGRLPFVVDIKAFFRITNSDVAAQRVSSFEDLQSQLLAVVQGAVRTILASSDIEEIMQGRSKFGDEFTKEVTAQLTNWGVSTVKNIELMDIRDSRESNVIRNIMEKKKSHIEMESRKEVAENMKIAQLAEIDAQRTVDTQKQEAEKLVGEKTAEKEKAVGIANEKAQQQIKSEAKVTKEKEMEVIKVGEVKQAEITKDVNKVKAEESRITDVIKAEGEKQKTILLAEGRLEEQRRTAEGILVEGNARAEAEKQMQLAPVEAQIVLAKEIGQNQSYQEYLIKLRVVEKDEAVGKEQAKALEKAEVKVIANTGNAMDGVSSAMQLFTPKGGLNVGGMLESLANTEQGGKLLNKFLGDKE